MSVSGWLKQPPREHVNRYGNERGRLLIDLPLVYRSRDVSCGVPLWFQIVTRSECVLHVAAISSSSRSRLGSIPCIRLTRKFPSLSHPRRSISVSLSVHPTRFSYVRLFRIFRLARNALWHDCPSPFRASDVPSANGLVVKFSICFFVRQQQSAVFVNFASRSEALDPIVPSLFILRKNLYVVLFPSCCYTFWIASIETIY